MNFSCAKEIFLRQEYTCMHKIQAIKFKIDSTTLEGDLVVPNSPSGLVIFSHGSGSSRFSPRNNFVAQQLQRRGIATLLFDLLTKKEDSIYENRFDIELLSQRLIKVTQQLKNLNSVSTLPFGYFGASTGAASALNAAAYLTNDIRAVVSRGGRPDLAMSNLHLLQAPVLLIVGGYDREVIELNKLALAEMKNERTLILVERATHLFEEPGTLEKVAELAGDWFVKYFSSNDAEKKSRPARVKLNI